MVLTMCLTKCYMLWLKGNKLDRDSGAGAQRSQSYAFMKQQMGLAAKSEDY